MIDKLEELKTQALADVEAALDPAILQGIRTTYLGKKGVLTGLLKGMRELSPDERKRVGQHHLQPHPAPLPHPAGRRRAPS